MHLLRFFVSERLLVTLSLFIGYASLAFSDVVSAISLDKHHPELTWPTGSGIILQSDDGAYALRFTSSGDLVVAESGLRTYSGIFHSATNLLYRKLDFPVLPGYAPGEVPSYNHDRHVCVDYIGDFVADSIDEDCLPGHRLLFTGTGHLLITDEKGEIIWRTDLGGYQMQGSAELRLNGSVLEIKDLGTERVVWSSETGFIPEAKSVLALHSSYSSSVTLMNASTLFCGDSMTYDGVGLDATDTFELALPCDGNLVLKRRGQVVWSTDTAVTDVEEGRNTTFHVTPSGIELRRNGTIIWSVYPQDENGDLLSERNYVFTLLPFNSLDMVALALVDMDESIIRYRRTVSMEQVDISLSLSSLNLDRFDIWRKLGFDNIGDLDSEHMDPFVGHMEELPHYPILGLVEHHLTVGTDPSELFSAPDEAVVSRSFSGSGLGSQSLHWVLDELKKTWTGTPTGVPILSGFDMSRHGLELATEIRTKLKTAVIAAIDKIIELEQNFIQTVEDKFFDDLNAVARGGLTEDEHPVWKESVAFGETLASALLDAQQLNNEEAEPEEASERVLRNTTSDTADSTESVPCFALCRIAKNEHVRIDYAPLDITAGSIYSPATFDTLDIWFFRILFTHPFLDDSNPTDLRFRSDVHIRMIDFKGLMPKGTFIDIAVGVAAIRELIVPLYWSATTNASRQNIETGDVMWSNGYGFLVEISGNFYKWIEAAGAIKDWIGNFRLDGSEYLPIPRLGTPLLRSNVLEEEQATTEEGDENDEFARNLTAAFTELGEAPNTDGLAGTMFPSFALNAPITGLDDGLSVEPQQIIDAVNHLSEAAQKVWNHCYDNGLQVDSNGMTNFRKVNELISVSQDDGEVTIELLDGPNTIESFNALELTFTERSTIVDAVDNEKQAPDLYGSLLYIGWQNIAAANNIAPPGPSASNYFDVGTIVLMSSVFFRIAYYVITSGPKFELGAAVLAELNYNLTKMSRGERIAVVTTAMTAGPIGGPALTALELWYNPDLLASLVDKPLDLLHTNGLIIRAVADVVMFLSFRVNTGDRGREKVEFGIGGIVYLATPTSEFSRLDTSITDEVSLFSVGNRWQFNYLGTWYEY